MFAPEFSEKPTWNSYGANEIIIIWLRQYKNVNPDTSNSANGEDYLDIFSKGAIIKSLQKTRENIQCSWWRY